MKSSPQSQAVTSFIHSNSELFLSYYTQVRDYEVFFSKYRRLSDLANDKYPELNKKLKEITDLYFLLFKPTENKDLIVEFEFLDNLSDSQI